jgi:hypothetical protein
MIRGLVKNIGSGIGLANEAIAHRKEKKEAKTGAASGQEQAPLQDASDSDPEDDEVAWRLDEASEAADLQQRPLGEDSPAQTPGPERLPEYTVEGLVDDFVAHHPIPPSAYSPPVILPQKRPRARGRGFVRAYALALGECGIDEATFLDFLDTFDKSTHVCMQHLNLLHRCLCTCVHF